MKCLPSMCEVVAHIICTRKKNEKVRYSEGISVIPAHCRSRRIKHNLEASQGCIVQLSPQVPPKQQNKIGGDIAGIRVLVRHVQSLELNLQ